MTRYILAAMVLLSGCAEQAAPKYADTHPGYQVVAYRGDDVSEETDVAAVCDYATCTRLAATFNAAKGYEAFYVEGLVVPTATWAVMAQDANEEDSAHLVAVCRDHADCSNQVEMANLEQAETGGSLVFYVSGDKTP